jgi:hypothetical protein
MSSKVSSTPKLNACNEPTERFTPHYSVRRINPDISRSPSTAEAHLTRRILRIATIPKSRVNFACPDPKIQSPSRPNVGLSHHHMFLGSWHGAHLCNVRIRCPPRLIPRTEMFRREISSFIHALVHTLGLGDSPT